MVSCTGTGTRLVGGAPEANAAAAANAAAPAEEEAETKIKGNPDFDPFKARIKELPLSSEFTVCDRFTSVTERLAACLVGESTMRIRAFDGKSSGSLCLRSRNSFEWRLAFVVNAVCNEEEAED